MYLRAFVNNPPGGTSAQIGAPILTWGYQDFTAGTITGTSVTLSANENGTGFTFDSTKIVNSSAVIVRKTNTESFAYSGTTRLFSPRVKVSTHTGNTAIVLNAIPHSSWGDLRIYYIYQYTRIPNSYTMAPAFIRENTVAELANLFLVDVTSATGDIIYRSGSGVTNLAVGSTDQVLTVSGGVPVWKDNNANLVNWKWDEDGNDIVLYYTPDSGVIWVEKMRLDRS
jgi:hypothetical protein